MLSRLLRLADKGLDVVIWLHHSIMLYICLVWLLPLFALVAISWLVWDLRPYFKGHSDAIFLYALMGYPLGLAVCLYAELATTPLARRLKRAIDAAPVYIGYIVLGLGGLFWLFGVI